MEHERIFLSAVSSEFQSARESLAHKLRAAGFHVEEQDTFVQRGAAPRLLRKLHDYIKDCFAVVCLVGSRTGAFPQSAEVAEFPGLLPVTTASYTQWEYFLARHFERRLYLYVADDDFPRDQDSPADVMQMEFAAHLVHDGVDRTPVSDVAAFREQVLMALLRDRDAERNLAISPLQRQSRSRQIRSRVRPLGTKRLQWANMQLLQANGWNARDVVQRTKDLDYELIPHLGPENEASVEELTPVYEAYTETWRVIVDEEYKSILGYWRFAPLQKAYYEKARSGALLDQELGMECMEYFWSSGVYDVYIAALEVHPYYHRQGLVLLTDAFLEILDELSEDDRYIGRICANGLSELGRKLCRDIKMEPLVPHESGKGYIFECTMMDVLIWMQSKIFTKRRNDARLRRLLRKYNTDGL